MRRAIVTLIVVMASFSLRLQGQEQAVSVTTRALGQQHQMKLKKSQQKSKVKKLLNFIYELPINPNSYRPEHHPSPQIMNYLPLTKTLQGQQKAIVPINPDIEAVKKYYLKAVDYNKTVDMMKAIKLAEFFTTEMGLSVLTYFQSLTEHGLNYYNLRPNHYRLWLAIKILAKRDVKMYARSMTEDIGLFRDFYVKAREKKIVEITGIPIPTPQLLRKFQEQQTRLLANPTVVQKESTSSKPRSLPAAPTPKPSPVLPHPKPTTFQPKQHPSEPKISANTKTPKVQASLREAPSKNISRGSASQAPKQLAAKIS